MIESMGEFAGQGTLSILLALFPGLITLQIIRALTIRDGLPISERIIQALLYTFLCHATWAAIGRLFGMDGVSLVGLACAAMFWGAFLSWLINSDKLHVFLRRMGLTKRTSRPNEWYNAFYRTEKYVVVHLKDGRRVFGYPRIWPDTPNQGHLFIQEARWLREEGEPGEERTEMLICVQDVQFVEFVPHSRQLQGESNVEGPGQVKSDAGNYHARSPQKHSIRRKSSADIRGTGSSATAPSAAQQ
jgi:hypothetical protein